MGDGAQGRQGEPDLFLNRSGAGTESSPAPRRSPPFACFLQTHRLALGICPIGWAKRGPSGPQSLTLERDGGEGSRGLPSHSGWQLLSPWLPSPSFPILCWVNVRL